MPEVGDTLTFENKLPVEFVATGFVNISKYCLLLSCGIENKKMRSYLVLMVLVLFREQQKPTRVGYVTVRL